MEYNKMRELNVKEIQEVNGGFIGGLIKTGINIWKNSKKARRAGGAASVGSEIPVVPDQPEQP